MTGLELCAKNSGFRPFETLEKNTVTVRDRDTMEQKRISEEELEAEFKNLF